MRSDRCLALREFFCLFCCCFCFLQRVLGAVSKDEGGVSGLTSVQEGIGYWPGKRGLYSPREDSLLMLFQPNRSFFHPHLRQLIDVVIDGLRWGNRRTVSVSGRKVCMCCVVGSDVFTPGVEGSRGCGTRVHWWT